MPGKMHLTFCALPDAKNATRTNIGLTDAFRKRFGNEDVLSISRYQIVVRDDVT